jgi:hypothetical protein
MSTPLQSAPGAHLDIDFALAQIGDQETLNSMLLMLQDSLARDLPHIADFLQAGDVPSANRLLHALKGFIPIFCQDPLCSQVVEVEALSKDSHSARVAPAYAALRPELERLHAEVGAYLHGLPS